MRAFSAGLVLAAVLFAAGCGGSSGGGGGGSSQASGLAAESANAVVRDASKAAQDAELVPYVGDDPFLIGHVRLDRSRGRPVRRARQRRDRIAHGRRVQGRPHRGGEQRLHACKLCVLEEVRREAGRRRGGVVRRVVVRRQVAQVPREQQDDFQALTSPTKANSIFKSLNFNHGKLENQGEKTYKGQSVVAITDTTKGGTLYVAATGTPYPVALTKAGGKSGGTITFDDWNQPVTLTAPKGALDLSQFGG